MSWHLTSWNEHFCSHNALHLFWLSSGGWMCVRDEFCICMRRKRRRMKELGQESGASWPGVCIDPHRRGWTCIAASPLLWPLSENQCTVQMTHYKQLLQLSLSSNRMLTLFTSPIWFKLIKFSVRTVFAVLFRLYCLLNKHSSSHKKCNIFARLSQF